MDALAVKQACKFAKEHALKNGPIVSAPIRFSVNFDLLSYPIFLLLLSLCSYSPSILLHSAFKLKL